MALLHGTRGWDLTTGGVVSNGMGPIKTARNRLEYRSLKAGKYTAALQNILNAAPAEAGSSIKVLLHFPDC